MLTATMTAGMIGVAIMVALVICVGGVILAAMGGLYLVRNRRERHAAGEPSYSGTVGSTMDPTDGDIAASFEDAPQWLDDNSMASVSAEVPEIDRKASDQRLYDRERRRSVALVSVGVLLAIAGLVMLGFLISELVN